MTEIRLNLRARSRRLVERPPTDLERDVLDRLATDRDPWGAHVTPRVVSQCLARMVKRGWVTGSPDRPVYRLTIEGHARKTSEAVPPGSACLQCGAYTTTNYCSRACARG